TGVGFPYGASWGAPYEDPAFVSGWPLATPEPTRSCRGEFLLVFLPLSNPRLTHSGRGIPSTTSCPTLDRPGSVDRRMHQVGCLQRQNPPPGAGSCRAPPAPPATPAPRRR